VGTAGRCVAAGATALVAGSAVFGRGRAKDGSLLPRPARVDAYRAAIAAIREDAVPGSGA